MKFFAQLLIFLLFTQTAYQRLRSSPTLRDLIYLALFFMLFLVAGTFEELGKFLKGLL